jgi:hypothetical protein
VILYHYSRPEPWPEILTSGYLDPRWPAEGDDWPKTVHFTDEADRLPTGFAEGRTLRFTVDVDAHSWTSWALDHDIPPEAYSSFGIRNPYAAPGQPALSRRNLDADHWYVTTERITTASWVEVRRLDTGAVLWPLPA